MEYNDLRMLLRRHGEEVDGFLVTPHELGDILTDAVEEGILPDVEKPIGFVIDASGKIWKDGVHVGFINKSSTYTELNQFASTLGAALPAVLDDVPLYEAVKPE